MDELDAIAARIVEWGKGDMPGPWTLEVYPTLRCNLSCSFCDTTDRHRPAQNELSAERWAAIVDEAADLGVRRLLVLGGGEPLLAPATPVIFARAKARGLAGFLTTNGTRLDRFAPLLVDIGWDEVHVSVDGADAATHDALRGQRGAFRTAVGAVCRLRRRRDEAGRGPRIALHSVVTNRNQHQLVGLVRLAHALGAYRLETDHLIAYRPEQKALAVDALPDSAIEAAEVEAERLGIETTLAGLRAPPRGTTAPAPGTGPGHAGAPCLKAWHHLVVQADGRTSPCCVLAGAGEAVTTVREVWEASPTLRAIRAGMLAGRPTSRCGECSENILAHERAIRARLPA